MATVINWQVVYQSLRDAGYPTAIIAQTAGFNRSTVSTVMNGGGHPEHEPKFSNGAQLLNTVKQAVAEGRLPPETLEQIKRKPVAGS